MLSKINIKASQFNLLAMSLTAALSFIVAQAQAITVDLTQTKAWNGGYLVDASITNDTNTTVNGWTLGFKLGSGIEKMSRATFTGSDPFVVKNLSYSAEIEPGTSEPFSFNGIGTFNAANIGNCVFNGVACTLTVNGKPVGGTASSVAASSTPASTAASSKPASSTPGSSKPASSTPESSTPASSTPASSKPASSTPSTGNNLYTQTGTDKTWKQLLAEKAIPIGVDSTKGITGSDINVNNSVVEIGPYKSNPIIQAIRIHTVGNSVINRSDFAKWSRWYQEDGNTQVFRIFKDETNVRNDRPEPAGRIESFSNFSYKRGEGWQEWAAHYTIIDIRGCVGPHYCGIFQGKSPVSGEEWGVMMKIKSNGDLFVHHRGSNANIVALSGLKFGTSFDLKIRDDGHNWESYVNGNLIDKGSWSRPTGRSVFRWGLYLGASTPTEDIMIFVTGAKIN